MQRNGMLLLILLGCLILMAQPGAAQEQNEPDAAAPLTTIAAAQARQAALEYLHEQIEMGRAPMWQEADLAPPVTLYDLSGEISAYLFAVTQTDAPVGYITIAALPIPDPVLESTLQGPSPLEGVLEALTAAGYTPVAADQPLYMGVLAYGYEVATTTPAQRMVFDARTHTAITLPDNEPITPLSQRVASAVTADAAEANEATVQDATLASDVVIAGVPDLDQFWGGYGCWSGCVPTAATTLMWYWGNHGYEALKSGGNWEASVNDMRSYMGTWCQGGEGATYANEAGPGIQQYTQSRLGYAFNTEFLYSGYGTVSFDRYRAEIDASQPVLIGMSNASYWTAPGHAFTGVGYNAATNQMIIQDNWPSTSYPPGLYYIQYGSGYDDIDMTTVAPPPTDPCAVIAVGEASGRQPMFEAAYNRDGGRENIGCPINGAHWWHGGVIQDFEKASGEHVAIIHDELRDDPINTVPAYVIRGDIFQHYISLDGTGSWLGMPTSDEFINGNGHPQSNFANGYITVVNNLWQAVAWPDPEPGTWRTEYRNGHNFNAAPTWVANEDFAANDLGNIWGEGAPYAGMVGVWADHFSVRWSRTIQIETAGEYQFTAGGDDFVQVWLDGELILDVVLRDGQTTTRHLSAGEHEIVIKYREGTLGANLHFSYEALTTATSSISGVVTDSSGAPLAGVYVATDAGQTTTTDNSGAYTLRNLDAATYTLTPLLNGYTFTPESRAVSVPPDATGQDFTATAEATPTPDAPRLVVFEAFLRPECGICQAAAPAIEQLAEEYANQAVVFLEHSLDDPEGSRKNHWWAAYQGSGSVTTPLIMVDSGHLISNGSVDFYNAYRSMVETELVRPPQAELTVATERVNDTLQFDIQLTNLLADTTLSFNNAAALYVLVYEETQQGLTERYVRAEVSTALTTDLAPGATASFRLETLPLNGVNWANLDAVVLAEYRPAGSDAYETLQAARAQMPAAEEPASEASVYLPFIIR